jgi:hypothetical protein
MANLQGGNYDKQTKNAFHRLQSFGVGRHGNELKHQTHSNALAKKREMYLRDYKDYAEREGFTEKLNLTMTHDNVIRFLNERTSCLKANTQENYTRGFSSMLKGLVERNITIPVQDNTFDRLVNEIKENSTPQEIQNGRYIDNVEKVIENIYFRSEGSGLVAELQHDLGLRASEAIELATNPEKYMHDGVISDLVGKGNHIYEDKMVSYELEQKLLNNSADIPPYSTYSSHMLLDMTSHDFRFTYASDRFNELTEQGIEYKNILEIVSKEMNHSRGEMTEYYLNRL